MTNLIGATLTSLIVSVFIFPILIKYSRKKGLLISPGGRRIHKQVTPSIGGVAIFSGFLVSSVFWIDAIEWPALKIILAVLSITFVLGLFDDLVQIKPLLKILGQALAGSVAFFLLDVKLSSFYGLLGNIYFNDWISYPLTIFTIIILTNAFNLIDGIDGLAGSFSVVCLLFFGTWFYVVGETYLSIVCLAMVGAIIGFLIFNWEPSKIFMGDTGALLIGMMISIAVIKFIDINYHLALHSVVKFKASVSTGLAIIILPVVDTVRIIIIRLSMGISPLTPDKRHIHHSLLRIGLSHQEAVMLLTSIHLFFISGALMLKSISELTVLFFVIALSLALSFLLHFFLVKQLRQENLI